MTHIPYKGGGDLYNGLLSKQIEAMADASGWISLVQGGQFRLLVVWGSKRMALFPQVRTLREAGIDLEVNSPYGVCGPRGMDPAVVHTLQEAFRKAIDDPEFVRTLELNDYVKFYMDSPAYTAWALKTYGDEKRFVSELRIKLDE